MKITEKIDTISKEPICTFTVKITPGSSQNKILGYYLDSIKIAIQAPPEKGAANKMLLKFLSKYLNIPQKNINILSGELQPLKTIQIISITKSALLQYFDIPELK